MPAKTHTAIVTLHWSNGHTQIETVKYQRRAKIDTVVRRFVSIPTQLTGVVVDRVTVESTNPKHDALVTPGSSIDRLYCLHMSKASMAGARERRSIGHNATVANLVSIARQWRAKARGHVVNALNERG